MRLPLIGQIVWLLYAALLFAATVSAADVTVFVGTYTNAQSKGIYSLQFDDASGKLSAPTLAAESDSPSFLAMHPTGRYLYAANEHPSGPANAPGTISAFAVDGSRLKLINIVSRAARVRATSQSIAPDTGCSPPTMPAEASRRFLFKPMARWAKLQASFSTR